MLNPTQKTIISLLKGDYKLAANPMALWFAYLEDLGIEITKENLINAPVKYGTIDRNLELVLREITEDKGTEFQYNYQKYGFTYTQYYFFRQCRQRGKQRAERVREKMIGYGVKVPVVYSYTGELKQMSFLRPKPY